RPRLCTLSLHDALPISALATTIPTFDMAVAGDIILGRGVNNKMLEYNDYLYPFRKMRDELMSADWRVANLECTITDLVAPPLDPDRKSTRLNSSHLVIS